MSRRLLRWDDNRLPNCWLGYLGLRAATQDATASLRCDSCRSLARIQAEIFADNVPEAFDIEERLLMEVFEFVSNIEMLSDDDLQDFLSKMALLEGERARLTLERQHKIAVME